MKTPFEVITSYGIPTHNWVEAAQFVLATDLQTKSEYERRIVEVLGLTAVPHYESQKVARVYFGYTIQETVRAFNSNAIPDMEALWEDINKRARKFITENPWSVREYTNEGDDGEPKMDAAGNPKQKKGAKKELAKNIWDNNVDKQKTMKRNEWIALLCEKVGLTPGGASTYYTNLKNGRL